MVVQCRSIVGATALPSSPSKGAVKGSWSAALHGWWRLSPDVRTRPLVKISVGYELIYDCPQPTPMMLVLNIHYSRASDIVVPDHLTTIPSVPLSAYRDHFGNWCTRLVAPKGQIRIASAALVKDSGEPDIVATSAQQHSIQDLPEEALTFLLGSRYCDTEKFSEVAWNLFGQTPL